MLGLAKYMSDVIMPTFKLDESIRSGKLYTFVSLVIPYRLLLTGCKVRYNFQSKLRDIADLEDIFFPNIYNKFDVKFDRKFNLLINISNRNE